MSKGPGVQIVLTHDDQQGHRGCFPKCVQCVSDVVKDFCHPKGYKEQVGQRHGTPVNLGLGEAEAGE